MFYWFFKPTLNLFDICWIVLGALLVQYLDVPWAFWLLILPMSAVSWVCQNKFVK